MSTSANPVTDTFDAWMRDNPDIKPSERVLCAMAYAAGYKAGHTIAWAEAKVIIEILDQNRALAEGRHP